ncbi:MAG: peptide chain release factor N(5)-glutamine methyltransferase [Prevotella sp.]
MTYRELWQQLVPIYGDEEAKSIARLVYDRMFGLSLTDICIGKDKQLSTNDSKKLSEIAARLLRNEPVQYVLGSESFGGREFHVAPGVLIPRPETVMLPRLARDYCRDLGHEAHILDIGTGSGCIAVSMALDIPRAHVSAWDISPEALNIARGNAREMGAEVDFVLQDALNAPEDGDRWDVIVSNPPYICMQERSEMCANVLDYEPSTALFVPDDDPLLFYRAISRYARTALKKGGHLLFEINPLYAEEMRELLWGLLYNKVEILADEFGKQRFAIATRA